MFVALHMNLHLFRIILSQKKMVYMVGNRIPVRIGSTE